MYPSCSFTKKYRGSACLHNGNALLNSVVQSVTQLPLQLVEQSISGSASQISLLLWHRCHRCHGQNIKLLQHSYATGFQPSLLVASMKMSKHLKFACYNHACLGSIQIICPNMYILEQWGKLSRYDDDLYLLAPLHALGQTLVTYQNPIRPINMLKLAFSTSTS